VFGHEGQDVFNGLLFALQQGLLRGFLFALLLQPGLALGFAGLGLLFGRGLFGRGKQAANVAQQVFVTRLRQRRFVHLGFGRLGVFGMDGWGGLSPLGGA